MGDDGTPADAYGADLLHELDVLRGLAKPGQRPLASSSSSSTSLRVQARALLRKSAMYQARQLSTNICIVSAPVLFCIFLLVVRAGMQQLMTGNEFTVGLGSFVLAACTRSLAPT
jgi:hypothetical protein